MRPAPALSGPSARKFTAEYKAVVVDRRMRANTSKERAQSLLNQGLFYFDCHLNRRDERVRPLMAKFDGLLRQHATVREVFGLI